MPTSTTNPTQTTIPVHSARRRLADGLLREEMEADTTLCVSTPTTFREFLSVLLDFSSWNENTNSNNNSNNNTNMNNTNQQHFKKSQNNNKISSSSSTTSTNNTNSSSSSASVGSNPEGRGALTDDSSNFSKKCDEARVRSVMRSHQIIDETLRKRKERQQKFQNDHEMRSEFRHLFVTADDGENKNKNSILHQAIAHFENLSPDQQREHDFLVTTSSSVLTLREWKEIVRAHPALLKFSLDRAMPRSETTATAMIADMPVTILPARDRDMMIEQQQKRMNEISKNNNTATKSTTSSTATKNNIDKKSSSLSAQDSEEENDEEILEKEQQKRKLEESTTAAEGKNNSKRSSSTNEEDDDNEIKKKSSSSSISTITQSGWSYATDYWQRGYQWLERFISGGIAGGVAKSVIAPGDRVKIIFQVNAELAFSLLSAFNLAKQIVQRNGPLGLWAGHGATLLRVVPYASISFATFEFYHVSLRGVILNAEELAIEVRNSGGGMSKHEEKKLNAHHQIQKSKENEGGHGAHGGGGHHGGGGSSSRQIVLRFVCGALAGATATTATYPLDLLRARYAAHSLHSSGRPYPSYFIGLKTIYQSEGLKSLYSGLGPTLLGIVPYAGASFTVFETLKSFVLSRNAKLRAAQEQQNQNSSSSESKTNMIDDKNNNNKKNELATWQRLSAGALSGLIAQSLTYPLDIVRRRMQVMPDKSKSMKFTLQTIYRESGIRGLYKGLTMNWVKGPIAVAVSFTINDWMKTRAQRYHAAVALENDELLQEGKSNVKKGGISTNSSNSSKSSNAEKDAAAAATGANFLLTPSEQKYKDQNKQIEKYSSLTERFAIGALAGASAKVWTIPFDRLKLMMALGRVTNDGISPGHQFKTVLDLLLQTRNPFQGAAGQLLRVMPFAAVSYTMFDLCQPLARRIVLTTESTFASDMIAGSVAAAAATVVAHPLDIIRSQFALAEKGGAPLPFKSYTEGLKMLLQEGSRSSPKILFAGLSPALMGVCPLAAFSFSIYHEGKRRGYADDGSFTSRMMLGAAAGVVGQVASYPLNLVRRRAIAQAEEEITESIANRVRAGLRGDSYSTFSSMYRRMPLGWTLGTMTLALSFAANDWMRDKLVDVRRKQARELLLRDPIMM